VDISVRQGRVFGLVGESGSGKSSLALGVLGLLAIGGRVSGGTALLGEVDLRHLGRVGLSKLRGRELAIIPQAAMSLLDPTMTILRQVQESTELTADKDTAKTRAIEMLERVGIPSGRHGAFPHELSGGQRQRVVIAMAVANQPKLLIADEPTTGLDVITQQEILALLEELRTELSLDILIISHDLPLIGAVADDIAIMYAGEIVETGATADVLAVPMHPYTRLLVAAMPLLDGPPRAAKPIPGDAPDPSENIVGCAFAPRCTSAEPQCREVAPQLITSEAWGAKTRAIACHVTIRTSEGLVSS
jgi:oligopeptide/dipeptide ABC transporter ATP-binding protein